SHRVIQVTSPAAGDGKSTLSLNLAITMAMSGKKTVLVDCDMRRPRVHQLTGTGKDIGVSDVLQNNAELSGALQSTEVENFFVLPCGSIPKNPAELLMRAEFGQLLHVLREKFEYVIVDTPPVMAVSDPCVVAAQVDGVILSMRLSRHTRELGRRTLEQLRDVGAVISGLVINGVSEGDYYGYGTYRYADYKGYSYG
ncbi:MAG: tyrosine-protein kinase family protein, partial [Planctomyces sp.]